MSKSKIIGLGEYTRALKKELTEYWIKEQTRLLIEYAEKEIVKLGNRMSSYSSANGLDRTGNLLNSLCWGVTFNGETKGSGFFRPAVLHSRGIDGGSTSYLHEFFPNDMEAVNGRQMAEDFIKSYSGQSVKWEVYFAVLAPYWGYWEGGFRMKSGGGTVYSGTKQQRDIPVSYRHMQFQVMSHVFDDVRMDLKPAKTHLSVYRPKYSYRNPRYKNKRGYRKIGIIR